MATHENKKQVDSDDANPAENADDTRSGTPNPADPNKLRDGEHKSGYGGEKGEPRTSSDQRAQSPPGE